MTHTPEIASHYVPKGIESRWYQHWLDHGCMRAADESPKPPYAIMIPPPNVTGSLHMGHALTIAIEDILVRYHRMAGCNTLWLPGTDHAGIATQMVVEREIQRTEGKTRHDLGREEFLRRVWAWKEKNGGHILLQLQRMGASVDWDRLRFTMDEGLSRAVVEVFVRLYEEGLIYRDNRLNNWCPRCHTALSDLEVEHEENVAGEMFSFAYPITGGGEIVVATTRPETMLGDTAVAVHPDDPRYRGVIGQKLRHPFVEREIPVIGDAILVDMAFGTGAVKVTPAHDFNDFATGKRHGLPMITIFDKDARVNAQGGPRFAGLDRYEARAKVKEALAELGLVRGAQAHQMAIGRCQRCDTVVEPWLSMQWWVKAGVLAQPAIAAVRGGRTRIIPQTWEKTYFNWMENIQDWCVSRQLWWGHQIPAWHCGACGHVNVAREAPAACGQCGGTALTRDPDVLDTWFSSALWPFSTLGWPEKTKALAAFYPGAVLETGFDILFFWVARMMMMGLHFMGEVPFREVFLHAMVRDWQGNKMSKTRGNVIDPLALIDGASAADLQPEVRKRHPEGFPECGADALRMALASMAGQGRDVKLDPERVMGYRHFGNKLWNAFKFAAPHLPRAPRQGQPPQAPGPGKSLFTRWMYARMARAARAVAEGIRSYQLNDAAMAAYTYVWGDLCDWYIELAKPQLAAGDPGNEVAQTLYDALDTALRILHPFMPFVTEELWQKMAGPRDAVALMVSKYPEIGPGFDDAVAVAQMDLLMEITGGIRTIRGESNIPPSRMVDAVVFVPDAAHRANLLPVAEFVKTLARVRNLTIAAGGQAPPQSAAAMTGHAEIYVPLAGILDLDTERARLAKELKRVEADLERTQKKLATPSFKDKAPADIVAKEAAKAAELAAVKARLAAGLARLG